MTDNLEEMLQRYIVEQLDLYLLITLIKGKNIINIIQ